MSWLKKITANLDVDVTKSSNWAYKAYGNGYWILKSNPIYAIDADDYGRFLLQENKTTIYAGTSFEDSAEKLSQKLEGETLEPFMDVDQNVLVEGHLGYTDNPREAGFIAPDGRMLNLSGASDGGRPGRRDVEHSVYFGGNKGMQEYIAQGNIRMGFYGSELYLDIYKQPTPEQIDRIRELIMLVENGHIQVDLRNGLGKYDKAMKFYRNDDIISLSNDDYVNPKFLIGKINAYFVKKKSK